MPLFTPGQIVSTPAALAACEANSVDPMSLINKHIGGDWGKLSRDDVKANVQAIINGARILSKYPVGDDFVYVITEADRSSTCMLLTSEY